VSSARLRSRISTPRHRHLLLNNSQLLTLTITLATTTPDMTTPTITARARLLRPLTTRRRRRKMMRKLTPRASRTRILSLS
jgi:hypothetical protein